jgi:hypothetical protein
MSEQDSRHEYRAGQGFLCPHTGKFSSFVWTDHSKPFNGNSCEHCTGEKRSLGNMLYDLNEKYRREAERS